MYKVYGIDFGMCYSSIATINDNGTPEVIQSDECSNSIASAVFFLDDGCPIIGEGAKTLLYDEPNKGAAYIKKHMGESPDEAFLNRYDPTILVSLIFDKMKKYTELQGYDVQDAMISYPVWFSANQKDAVIQAGRMAGINIFGTILEPLAATLFHVDHLKKNNIAMNRDCYCLVYDLGGSFDATLIKASESELVVLQNSGDLLLGGSEWDNKIYTLILEKYEEQTGACYDELSDNSNADIFSVVETIKKTLSLRSVARMRVNDIRLPITRAEFERASSHLVDETMTHVDHILRCAGLKNKDIDALLAVGGGVKMPMIQERLNATFGKRVMYYEPELTVVKGTALAAAYRQEDLLVW